MLVLAVYCIKCFIKNEFQYYCYYLLYIFIIKKKKREKTEKKLIFSFCFSFYFWYDFAKPFIIADIQANNTQSWHERRTISINFCIQYKQQKQKKIVFFNKQKSKNLRRKTKKRLKIKFEIFEIETDTCVF